MVPFLVSINNPFFKEKYYDQFKVFLSYFISSDIAHNTHQLKHQYKLQNHHDREVSIQRTALAYARKFDHFLYSLYTERKHVIDSAHFYTGSKYMELEHLNGQLIHISI